MTAWTNEHSRSLPAAPEAVFAAITEPARLTKWFAEHVAIEPRSGGDYRFWGRHTYGVPRAEQATQRITRLQSASLLAFSWSIDDTRSEVTITLAAAPVDAASVGSGNPGHAATQLTLRHEFAAIPTVARAKDLIDDLWRMTLGNLDAYLRGGAGIVLPDFTDPHPEVRASIYIDAPRTEVFQALIEPEKLNKWLATAASVEPRIGGRYSYGWNYPVEGRDVAGGPTRILEIVPNEKLVTDWPDWRGDATVPNTTVTWLLESVGKGTRVTVIHSGFTRTTDISDYTPGWAEFLEKLKALVE